MNNASALFKSRIALSCVFLLYGVSFAGWASRIPDIKARLHLTDPELGGVLLAMPLGTLLSFAVAGIAVTKFKSRVVVMLSFCFFSASFSSLGLIESRTVLFLGLMLFGFFGNLLNVSINTQAVGVEKEYQKSIMASFHAIFSAGFMLGAAAGGLMSKNAVPAFLHFSLFGLLNVVSILFAYSFLLNKTDNAQTPKLAFVTSDKSLWLLGLMVFCGVFSEGAMIDWSAVYYRQWVEDSAANSSAAFTTFSIAMMIGRFSGDYLVNRYGSFTIQLLNGLFLGLGAFVSLISTLPALVFAGYMLIGLSIANIVPLTYSLAGKSIKVPSAVALTSIATVGYFGVLLGPALIGFISGWATLRVALGLIVILGIAIALLSVGIKRSAVTAVNRPM